MSRASQLDRYDRLKAKGLCVTCGNAASHGGGVRCRNCARHHATQQNAYRYVADLGSMAVVASRHRSSAIGNNVPCSQIEMT
jgi:hypothetical protein